MDKNTKDKKRAIVLSSIKMVDVGEKPLKGGARCVGPSESPKVYYPSLYLNLKQAPELADVEGGKEMKLVVDAVMRSKTTREVSGKPKTTEFSVDIKKIGMVK